MPSSPWVFDTTDENFSRDVVVRSLETPVVVDVWAPWCAPCRVLAPVLERLVDELGGAVLLAKLNADENPVASRELGVQSIPAVRAFRNGVRVAEFVGAQPEPVLRRFLQAILPTEADRLAREGATRAAAGDPAGAEAGFRDALDRDPRHAPALLGFARLLAARGDVDEGLRLLERVPPTSPLRREGEHLAATLRTTRDADGDEAALAARLRTDPEDVEARYALGRLLAARGEHERALTELLRVVRLDRRFEDDGARKAMLDLFELLGPEDPLVERFRGELAKALFR